MSKIFDEYAETHLKNRGRPTAAERIDELAKGAVTPSAITRAMVREVVDRAIHEYATYCMPPDTDALLDIVMAEQGEPQ